MFDSPTQSGPATTSTKSPFDIGGDSMFSANPAGYAGGAALPVPPTAAAPPPMFGSATGTKKPARKATNTFMGGGAITPNSNQLGGNTLLGQ